MERHHIRRHDKAQTDQAVMDRVLESRHYVTVAMCSRGEPYLVALSHGYDPGNRRIYFHCAEAGRKIDILDENPRVWGECIEDHGYLDGRCDHAYVSVHFGGRVTFVEDYEEKRRALELLIRRHESDPTGVMERNLKPEKINSITIGRIDIESMTCKQALPGK